jgi:hypothetical protein
MLSASAPAIPIPPSLQKAIYSLEFHHRDVLCLFLFPPGSAIMTHAQAE